MFKFDLQRFDDKTDNANTTEKYGHISNTHTFNSKANGWLNTHRAIGLDLEDHGNYANQMAITTTNVAIYSNDMRVGFVQSFQPSEQREITPIQELGTEGVVQMVPGNTRGGTIQMQRVALYNSDIWNALGLTQTGKFVSRFSQNKGITTTVSDVYYTYGNPFRTLKDQRVPLELRAETALPAPDGSHQNNALVERY